MNGMGITLGYSLASYMGLAFYYDQANLQAQVWLSKSAIVSLLH